MIFLLAQAAGDATLSQTAAQVEETVGTSGWLIFWLILAVIFVPFVAGSLIAKALRLKDFSNRIGTVLFCMAAALTPFVWQLANGRTVGECFRLGIDLAGGTNLVYQIDKKQMAETAAATGDDGAVKDIDRSMDNMVGAIIRRVNPSGTEEVTVRRVGSDRIEIIIPGKDQAYVDEMKARITRLGTLEFQILATPNNPEHRSFITKARELPDTEYVIVEKTGAGSQVVGRWVDVDDKAEVGVGGGELLPAVLRTIGGADGREQVLLAVSPKDRAVTGRYLVRATEEMDQSGRSVVGFTFDSAGGDRFLDLTSQYKPTRDGQRYRLAVVLDGKVQSAPSIKSTIGNRGVIEGQFTPEERRSLVSVLNAGALDLPLNRVPISEFTISPLLGVDIRNKGINAIVISAVVVIGFMALYYLKAGFIAVLCLLLNMLLIMGTMVFVQGTFTLPGLAGLVLTIGMAVDANVLIFERMREELSRGASTRMAIHNGFDKAFSAIIDSNLTTLIVAVILFMIGTDQVKGFAVTLFIGIVMSMFSALYFGRLVFEILEHKRMLKTMPMLSMIKSSNFQFMSRTKLAMVGSGALIVAGLACFGARGQDNLDIDFRGGTMVTFQFEEPQKLSDFRAPLEERFSTSITVERLTLETESPDGDAGRRWRLRTTEANFKNVREGIAESLESFNLLKVTVAPGPVEVIEAAVADSEDGEAAPEAAEAETAFVGGHRTALTFSSEITVTTAMSSFLATIESNEALSTKYPEPGPLLRLAGTEGSGVNASENQVRKFKVMELETHPNFDKADLDTVLGTVVETMRQSPLFEEVSNFDTAVGSEMQEDALIAMLASMVAIVIYIWFRFERLTFGLAAMAATIHDVLVVLGGMAMAAYISETPIGPLLALNDFKINLPIIAAFLTIVGYSLNDTIVIFDRIREVRGKNPAMTSEMIDVSLNQTLSRTLLTSLTTLFVVAILYAFGGEGIHGFAFCLLVGVIVGSYSSLFIASPILLWLMNREARLAAAGK